LERRVAELEADNAKLEEERKTSATRTAQLERDRRYLRQVLENESALAPLLARIANTGGADKLQFVKSPNGSGVCLHLAGERVSVEICDRCNAQSRQRQSTLTLIDGRLVLALYALLLRFLSPKPSSTTQSRTRRRPALRQIQN